MLSLHLVIALFDRIWNKIGHASYEMKCISATRGNVECESTLLAIPFLSSFVTEWRRMERVDRNSPDFCCVKVIAMRYSVV